MALILLIAAALSAQPPRLVLGKDAGADLELGVPAGARVTFSTSVGAVGAPREKDGVVRARFAPPALRAPSVALVLAQIDVGAERRFEWLSIPLSGSDTMEIETRPGSEVVAAVATSTIGPVKADARGIVRLPMVVPPGVQKATLKITDRLGNSTEKPLDLDPPPFSRIRMAARQPTSSAVTPVEIEVFVVKPDGTPDAETPVEVASRGGGDIDSRGPIAPGVWLVEYTAPEVRGAGTVTLDARAGGQLATLEVGVRPLAPGESRSLWHSSLAPERPWSVAAGVLAGGGVTFEGAGSGTALIEGSVRLGTLPLEATLDLGGGAFGMQSQYGTIPSLTERVKPHSWVAQAGVRASRQIAGNLDAVASLSFGLQDQVVKRTLPANIGTVQDSQLAARIALALGVSTRAGPGRVLGQVQFDGAPHDIAHFAGSTSGFSAVVGYLFTVR